MSKNLSIHSLVLLVTGVTLLVFGLAFGVWNIMQEYLHPILSWAVVTILFGGVMFLVLRYMLHAFVYRRIKLIYKMIRSSKETMKNEENANTQTIDNLARVENEVRDYVVRQQKEIDSLKEMENYRKNFLGNISHELKTPIFSVQGYIHTLLDGGLNDDSVNRRFLQKAAKNIERLETVVNDLEIIAKLEDATTKLEFHKFDLKELTREVIDELEVQAKQREIMVKFKPGADKAFNVEADGESIRTVLLNLIGNSIKYNKEGGESKIAFYDMESHVLVEVADNGIGIEEQHLKHLFDRFYRVDKSRSRERGGSGLGLSIVKHIIEAHGQRINVRSTPGRGTTIGFTLKKAS